MYDKGWNTFRSKLGSKPVLRWKSVIQGGTLIKARLRKVIVSGAKDDCWIGDKP